MAALFSALAGLGIGCSVALGLGTYANMDKVFVRYINRQIGSQCVPSLSLNKGHKNGELVKVSNYHKSPLSQLGL
jgi:hypothetical protein